MMPEDRAARIVHRLLSPHSSWEQFERILFASNARTGTEPQLGQFAPDISPALKSY